MSLATYQNQIITLLKQNLGKSVKQVEKFSGQINPGEVKATLCIPPAVLIYVNGGAIDRQNGGQLFVKTTCTAYCLTGFNDKIDKASQDAQTLAERVAEFAEGNRFGLDQRVNAAQITAIGNGHQLGLADKGFSLWLVTWEQYVLFGQKSWLDFEDQYGIEKVPLEVWLGDEQLTDAEGKEL